MKKIFTYLPDILILAGAILLSYNFLRPAIDPRTPYILKIDYHTEWKVAGIALIVLGLDIGIRRYLANRKRE